MRGKILRVALVGIVVVGFLLTAFAPPAQTSEPKSAWKPPKQVVIGTTSTKALGYIVSSAICGAVTDKTGVKFSVLPGAKTMDRFLPLRQRRTDLQIGPSAEVLLALRGEADFKKWGPQSVRVVWVGGPTTDGFAVRGDSGIKTISDLKGKKVAAYPGYWVIHHYYMEAGLAFGGLTWDDVKPTNVAGFAAGMKSVHQGKTDTAFMATYSPTAYELEASIHGIHWIPFPASDTAGWARFQKISPFWYPVTLTKGAGISKDNPAEVWGYNYLTTAYDWQSEELVYWWVKQMHETYNMWKGSHGHLPAWNIKHALDTKGWFAPYHAGAVRYFKDQGLWTDEMEAKQKKLLDKYPQKMTK